MTGGSVQRKLEHDVVVCEHFNRRMYYIVAYHCDTRGWAFVSIDESIEP
jgi:hypothetical protein